MTNRHIVKENKTLQRDMHSKAIINTDNNAYRDYMNKMHSIKRRDEEIKDILENEIKDILENDIKNKIDENTEDCKKMSSHIDFVERVYSALKFPLNYLTSGFPKSGTLPSLEG